MKKLLLVFAMLFASVSSSFAYQQETLYAYGGYVSTVIDVNSNVTAISLSATWDTISSYNPSGAVSVFDESGLSNMGHSWSFYPGGSSYNNTINFDYYNPQYFGAIFFTLSATDCNGRATLTVY